MASVSGCDFHAEMDEPEPGVFRATYRADTNPDRGASEIEVGDPRILPDMHVGTDAAGVKMWVEQLAASRGYQKVVWDRLPPALC
ncbi:MAG: hypothetical protein ACREF1_00190 [Acetobacteraceae bacterium]